MDFDVIPALKLIAKLLGELFATGHRKPIRDLDAYGEKAPNGCASMATGGRAGSTGFFRRPWGFRLRVWEDG